MAQIANTEPWWPTTVRSRKSGGRVIGTDNSVWLYRAVPMAPVVDAVSPEISLSAAEPLMALIDELSTMTPVRMARRSTAKAAYRQIHILLINIPSRFSPSKDSPIASQLAASFPNESVDRRLLLVGVRLIDKIGGTGGLKEAVDSVVETLTTGGAPLSDFDRDYQEIDTIMARSGMSVPTAEDFRLANAWWNHGSSPDAPTLIHEDHIHIFGSADSARTAARLVDDIDCAEWPAMPRHHTISFGCVQDFDLPFVEAEDRSAHWAAALIDEGAVAISIRGKIEPPRVTRAELRRRKKQYIDDIRERESQGKMSRAEQEEMLEELSDVEAIYSTGGPPTLTECSTLVVFAGRDTRQGYDLSDVGRGAGLIINSMVSRQETAMSETWMCSPVRANPWLHDLPSQTIAASGLPSLSLVGDAEGALLGFTERDRQPSYISATAAADEDSIPVCLVAGQSGSGKLIPLPTPLPTPSGSTTMGELRVGDEIFGGDGRPCRVTFLSPIEETPVLYDIHFSDGQVVTACKDHQWLVSNWQDRNKVRHPRRVAAVENWDSSQQLVEDLSHLALQFSDADMLTSDELMLAMSHLETSWKAPIGVSTALDFVDCPSETDHREIVITGAKSQLVKTDPVVLFPVVAALQACREKWLHPGAANAARWGQAHFDGYVAAADALIAATDPDEEATVADIARRLQGAGAEFLQSSRVLIASYARKAGIPGRAGHATVTVPIPDRYLSHPERRVWSAPLAFKSLAVRVSMMFAERPNTVAESRVLSTEEMVVAGVRQGVGQQAEFAVHVAGPLSLPRADLPVDPYVLGAWLGDGSSGGGTITQGESAACTDQNGLTDRAFLIGQLVDAGIDASASTSIDKSINTRGLATKLRQAGVLRDKHIPMAYLRASADQRLSLLQGLMDTDGTVDKNGACELCLCDERLVTGALELIRSLGIKASISSGPAVITEPDPERPGHKRRRVTGTRWRICFTTTTPVFRLPRKLDRLPEKVRETQQWIYIEKIVPVPTQPARCITVDSPDHTYLVKQFIPTHNTVSMLYLADQFARLPNARGERTPVVIIDPKALALDTPLPTPTGQTQMGEIQVGDEVYGSDGKPCRVTHLSRVFERPDLYAVTFDDGQVIRADADHQWAVTELAIMHNGAGVAERRQRAVADAEIILRLIDGADGSHDVSVGEMFTIITNEGCRMWGSAQSLFRVLRREGCLPLSDLPRYRWNLQIALKTIHGVLDKAIWSHRPSERVVTTAEMLDQGVHQKSRSGQARFAVKTAKPFERPDVDLSVDPYILGVWLGDGRTKNKEIACGAEDVNAMVSSLSECWQNISVHPDRPGASLISLDRDFSRCLYGHDEYVDRKRGAGTSKHCKECWRVQTAAWSGRAEDTRKMVNPSLHHLLNDAGVIGNKHIPAVYQRASVAQRFALLQGIMDTDGTVKRSGSCRLVLTHKRLITDALELIRGLGYKATPWEGPATITEDDPENPGKKRLRVTGTAYCINFKTSDPVFRMQRKLDLLPKNIPVCSTWHYIQSIEPIESAPARCIVVDSPDHTYLAGQFIPTHNSGSDHSAAVMASGGRVASLDSLAAADGVFDPMRFAIRREVGVELASSMLMAVNPWGGEKLNYETPLIKALAYGSEAGADCIGQALKLALDGGAAPAEMVNRVLDLADASPMFRACVGMESGGPTLRTSEGITLIKVGDAHFDLPEPGAIQEVTQPQRVALALVRMMVFGSAMALTNRQGIIMLDEAWVFLGAGRSEVERLGRLARSQQVFPMLFTQRVTDALDAGLSGYISRGLILPIQDPEEAAAACELFRLEPTPERLQRLTARGTIGGTGDQAGAPNWGSMRALRDQETGEVLRGAIGVYVDLSGRAVPVEIKVPKSFFDRASTNPDDIRRRIALQEQPPLTETETYFQPVVEPLGGQTPVAVPPNPLEW